MYTVLDSQFRNTDWKEPHSEFLRKKTSLPEDINKHGKLHLNKVNVLKSVKDWMLSLKLLCNLIMMDTFKLQMLCMNRSQ